ncbi:hypothetical protein [Prevotella sp. 885]|uniref:hypothetical protein n=1 Tax=Prevotella sp. 885 TaxID=2022527 RepID=UPI000BA11553|nr:hypothetical protein [Prevotella sp. 885]OZT04957.1 hypothetical protein CHL74_01855 [Prevotella sp. 885]
MTTFKKITEFDATTTLNGTDYIMVVAGGTPKRITLDNLRAMMEENQQQFLDENAFYIEENTASSKGAAYCETGGSSLMLQIWLSKICAILMTTDGHFTRLNPSDHRYTADGDQVVKNGAVVDAYKNADWFGMIEGGYWNYLQEVTISGVKHIRHHISLTPLPGGWFTKNIPVGMFKCVIQSGQMRSIPFVVPSGGSNINQFFNYAQARSKNHGLAGEPFRNFLLQYMMAKYGYRDIQNLAASDGTKIFGSGLDGTEKSASSTLANGFARQKSIKTGACLALGYNDGKAEVKDEDNYTCHSVNVGVWENPYGQYWEMDGHLCSVGTDVYQWDENFLPTGTPTVDSFAAVKHNKLTRLAAEGYSDADITLITTQGAQHMSYVPTAKHTGITYGDHYWYNASGQLWIGGGPSSDGAYCGLASASSGYAWSYATASLSARLDFHGDIKEVTSAELKRLLAS